jgi:HK97 family phage prohead protease
MMELAIVQRVVHGRDGSPSVVAVARPDEVRRIADRMMEWTHREEGCSQCRTNPATRYRGRRQLCGTCANTESRFVSGVSSVTRLVAPDVVESATTLNGYAIVFNKLSVNLGGFVERINPSAVMRSINGGQDIRSLWSHDSAIVLGRTKSGTLGLRADTLGVRSVTDPPKWASAYVESVQRGDVSGQSFGFHVMQDGDEWTLEDGMPTREVFDMEFSEISGVAFPAYPQTTLSAGESYSRLDALKRWHKTMIAR